MFKAREMLYEQNVLSKHAAVEAAEGSGESWSNTSL